MKAITKKLLAMLLIAALALSLIPAVSARDEGFELLGRSALLSMEDGEEYVLAYDRIARCIENREPLADLSDLTLSCSEFEFILEAYRNDPHGHFWVDFEYSYSFGTYVTAYFPVYNSLAGDDLEDFQKNREAFEKAAQDLLARAGVKSYMSDYEKELRIHDALVLQVDYVDGENAYNEYGALVDGACVCQGYTLAFQYLLRLVDVSALAVTGNAGGPHTWNIVRIDGDYYHTDVTWDDPVTPPMGDTSDIFYEYFNVTEEKILEDHYIDVPAYPLPKCTSEDQGYFKKNPSLVLTSSDVTAERIASLMKDGLVKIYMEDGECEYLCRWFTENCADVAILAGFDLSYSTSVSYVFLGDEVHLMIYGTQVEKEPEYILGDLDGDGYVSSIDSNILRRFIAGNATPTSDQLRAADLNGDGSLASIDSNLLVRKIAGAA